MLYKHNKNLVSNAKTLRKNMTKEERRLWFDFLRSYPIKFLRQKVIGNFIVDFYCPSAKLIVEIDGSQHFEDDGIVKDAERTAFLQQFGLAVIRFTNNEVNQNFTSVCESIDNFIKQANGK